MSPARAAEWSRRERGQEPVLFKIDHPRAIDAIIDYFGEGPERMELMRVAA